MPVEVAYATPEKQLIIALDVPLGTTAYGAVLLSNITEEFSAIDPEADPMGIYSSVLDGKNRPTPREYVLQARDRVEIYRPLTMDPNTARLKRAESSKSTDRK
ncbi:MAG: RnfH family protein [Gammaproteobacteria bacterium]|nr:RnfH family protein [Gammaproteobacteria bacterium]